MPTNTIQKKREYGTWCGVPWIAPIRGRRYLRGKGNTVNKEIFYDTYDLGPLLPFEPLIPYFQKIVTFELTWDEVVTQEEAARMQIQPIKTFNKEIPVKNPEGVSVPTTQSMCIIRRNEKNAYFLFNHEVHPLILNRIITIDSGEIEFVIVYRLRIKSAWEVTTKYPDGRFLLGAQAIITEKLGSIYRNKKFDSVRSAKEEGFDSSKEKIIKELNRKNFKDCPFELDDLHIEEIIVSANSQDRIDAGETYEIEKINAKTEKMKAIGIADATREKGKAAAEVLVMESKAEAEGIKVIGEQEVIVLKNKLKEINDFDKLNRTYVNKSNEAVATQMKELKGTLVTDNLFNDETSQLLNQVKANLITKK